MQLSMVEEAQFQASTHCYMCEGLFHAEKENLKKVRDHNHATGEYRGAAHSICNLNKRGSKHIPVFYCLKIHNASGISLLGGGRIVFLGDKLVCASFLG